jgi:hypothetical protein
MHTNQNYVKCCCRSMCVYFFLCALVFLCGCDSFHCKDSLLNSTQNSWSVNVGLRSGRGATFNIAPEALHGFMPDSFRESPPELVQITAVSEIQKTNYHLSAVELTTLREKSGGELNLVLFEEGFAIVPKDLEAKFARVETVSEFANELRKERVRCLELTSDYLK